MRASALARPEFKANPYPFYARMRQVAPVFSVSAPFFGRVWLVTRYDAAVAALKDDRLSKDTASRMSWLPRFARPLTRQLLNRDPPDHTRLRRLVSQAFTPRCVEQLRNRVQEVCDERLTAASRSRAFDLVADYALPIPLTVIADLLGIPVADRRRFHWLAQGSLSIGAPTRLLDVPRALPYLWLLMRYFRGLFAERRARPQDDLVSALVQAEEAGDRLDEDELLGMAVILLVAGYETTVNLIGSGSLALLGHPDERERFVGEPALGDVAVEELLRYTSPVEIATPRIAREDVGFGSVTIPRGEFVGVVLGSANHDEARFAEPETLDLGRDPNPHVAFGLGPHFCLGASLTRLEGRIALETLFRRLPTLRLTVPGDAVRWRRTLPLRGPAALPVAV